MTLPSSPPITLLQVYTEFGAPVNTPLSQFYQGGPWVGTGGANVNVPTAPPIGLLNLLGAASGGSTSGFIATVSTSTLQISGNSSATRTSFVICSTTGQTGVATFKWVLVSGDTGISINSPTSATTTFSANTLSGSDYSGVFQCVCTDSASHVTTSPTVTVTIISTSRR